MKKKTITQDDVSGFQASLRKVVTALNKAEDIVKGGMYHTIPGAMQDRLEAMGLVSIPWLMLFMQELGILRYWGGGKSGVWQVICITYFEDITPAAWVERAHSKVEKHCDESRNLLTLRQRVAQLEAASNSALPAEAVVGSKSLDEIAEMVVRIEELEAEVAKLEQQTSSLKQELAAKPKIDPDTALAAAIRKVRERQLA